MRTTSSRKTRSLSKKKAKAKAAADAAAVAGGEGVDADYELDFSRLTPIDRSILDHVQYLYDPETHEAMIPHVRPHYVYSFPAATAKKRWSDESISE